MSLLLEALKKAEKAKEEAQRRAREGGSGEPADAAASPAPVPERKAPPLEILNEDAAVPPKIERAAPVPTAELTIEAAPPPKAMPPKAGPRATARAAEEAAGRASAKNVFEAKFREPNPRLPFYVTLGCLGVFAFGTIIYFWYQLRPPPALVYANPPPAPPAAEAPVAPARGPVVAQAPATATIAGLPAVAPSVPVPAKAPAVAAAVDTPAVETPRLTPRIQPAARLAPPAAPEAPVVARTPPQVNPRVDAGYSAYMAGDLAAARTEYEQALRDDPANRDALLGMAALDVRAGRYETAEVLYLRVLATDPRDAQAQAALIALRSGRADPLVTESRVKSLLAADPGAHALNFTLGNQLATQRRWAEAQQEYFKAYTAEPDNADFAYNLAVSLDHLRQTRQALDYYERAIALAAKRGASFDLAAAKSRAAQLAQ